MEDELEGDVQKSPHGDELRKGNRREIERKPHDGWWYEDRDPGRRKDRDSEKKKDLLTEEVEGKGN